MEIAMSSYFYKTNAAPALAAIDAWDAKRAEFDRKREALKDVFGGPGSPMYSGSDSYVGGVKISDSRDLDVHWRRPDEYGYRALRHAAKPEKGVKKEARVAYKAEHERLVALWQEHCPDRISKDDVWKAIGVDWGSVWLSGGVFFKHEGVVYLNLGFQLKEGGEHIEGAAEIVASEFEAARLQVLNQRKAA
ncbi:LPD29 domain-containing protein [Pseudomonas sp. IT-P74]